jgi:fused signal recognition particle receptor
MGSDPARLHLILYNQQLKTDIVIIDTAGRLHNKINLMNELPK